MKKKIKNLVLCSFIFLLLIICISMFCFLHVQNTRYTLYSNDKEISYIVIPGAKITDWGPGYALEDRLYAGLSLYNPKKTTIFLSGGYDKGVKKHEVDVMYDYMRSNNVKIEDILLDYEGHSTIETIKNIKKIAENKNVLICTQKMYAPRNMYLAKQLDLNACILICDESYSYDTLFAYLREYLACTKAVLQTLF